MHTTTLKKLAFALTFWLALHFAPLKAQLLGPYGTSPITFGVDSNGLLSATGTFGTGSLSLSGTGTEMFWYPGKAAFRAGSITDSGTQWNDANIGHYSVAFGLDTTASGAYSTASGMGTIASGAYSTASGVATTASGYYSTASGYHTSAIGYTSTAMGAGSTAIGYYSTASGETTTASGNYSTAFGYFVTAQASNSFVIGAYNLGLSETGAAASATSWVATDPLFEIGNGTRTTPADAFIVYKNGDATLQGTLNVAPGGDIPMYTGN
jgi:hypothetical protein